MRGEAAYFVASNSGKKPALIGRSKISSPMFDGLTEIDLRNPNDAFLLPGTRQVPFVIKLKLSASDSYLLATKLAVVTFEEKNDVLGTIHIEEKGSAGQTKLHTFPLTGTDLYSIVISHASRCYDTVERPTFSNGCSGMAEIQRESDQAHQSLQNKLKEAAKP